MKKILIMATVAPLMFSSCGSYTGAGAYTGAQFGSILGSAIGGISNGPRGSDVGTIVGMAGGAIVGGAIGNAADQKARGEMQQHRETMKQRRTKQNQQYQYEQPSISGYDANNSGDDRIDIDGSDANFDYQSQSTTYDTPSPQSTTEYEAKQSNGFQIESTAEVAHVDIRNARFIDADGDNVISRGETCQVVFEIMNAGSQPLFDVVPMVVDMSNNKHVYISPSIRVERIAPGKGIRYTAMVKADNRLKDGSLKICCSVMQGDKTISEVSEFNIQTKR